MAVVENVVFTWSQDVQVSDVVAASLHVAMNDVWSHRANLDLKFKFFKNL
jgi:hypothetical protein